jgi:hypothetical protein
MDAAATVGAATSKRTTAIITDIQIDFIEFAHMLVLF